MKIISSKETLYGEEKSLSMSLMISFGELMKNLRELQIPGRRKNGILFLRSQIRLNTLQVQEKLYLIVKRQGDLVGQVILYMKGIIWMKIMDLRKRG